MSFAAQIETGDGSISPIGSTLYGICSTAAATAAKVVTLSDFDTLLTGVTIHVKFIYSNTAASPTLNVNSTGDIAIYAYGTSAPGNTAATSWAANSVVSLTYDGTYWRMNDVGANAAIITLLENEVDAEETAREADTTMILSRIAPDYDNTATYHINDLTVHSQQLYKANQDIPVAEEWTAAHWTATTVAAEREYKLEFYDTQIGVASTATADIGASTGITAATVDVNTFENIISTTGEYVFTYVNTDWTYNSNVVTLSNYGITVTGTAANGDTVTISYTAGTAPFKQNATYAAFPYRSTLPLTGVRSTMVVDVIFGCNDAISGMFAPIVESYDGGIYLYATNVPPYAVTIPTIVARG